MAHIKEAKENYTIPTISDLRRQLGERVLSELPYRSPKLQKTIIFQFQHITGPFY